MLSSLESAWKTINMLHNKKSKTTQIAALEVNGSLISDSKGIAESMNYFSVALTIPLVARYLKHQIHY